MYFDLGMIRKQDKNIRFQKRTTFCIVFSLNNQIHNVWSDMSDDRIKKNTWMLFFPAPAGTDTLLLAVCVKLEEHTNKKMRHKT